MNGPLHLPHGAQQPPRVPPMVTDKVGTIVEAIEYVERQLAELYGLSHAADLGPEVLQRIQAKSRALGHQREAIADIPTLAQGRR